MPTVNPYSAGRIRLPVFFLTILLSLPGELKGQTPDSPDPRLEGLPVRTVTIHGLRSMDEEVVLRRLELRPGSPWLSERARRDERAVTGLMIFWSARISAEGFPEGADPAAVDVHLHLEERIGWFVVPQLYWTPEESWFYGLAAVTSTSPGAGTGSTFRLLPAGPAP